MTDSLRERTGPPTGFDIGGTWLRHRSGDTVTRRPAPSLLNHPGLPVETLWEMLISELTTAVTGNGRVVVSLGAAMDDLTSQVHGSSPLWGDARLSRNLRTELRQRRPDVEWHVHNDVTCALADFAANLPAEAGHVGYLTVSSGIALKIADLGSRTVTVDGSGLQGEIGHLPAAVPAGHGRLLDLPCACGGAGHVAAVSAGPAIPRVAEALGLEPFDASAFPGRLSEGDTGAWLLLDTVTYPLAQAIRWLWTTQPRLTVTGIGGGVAEALGAHYQRSLEDHLKRDANYSQGDAGRQTVRVLAPGETDPIRGARLLADGFLSVVKT